MFHAVLRVVILQIANHWQNLHHCYHDWISWCMWWSIFFDSNIAKWAGSWHDVSRQNIEYSYNFKFLYVTLPTMYLLPALELSMSLDVYICVKKNETHSRDQLQAKKKWLPYCRPSVTSSWRIKTIKTTSVRSVVKLQWVPKRII